MNLSKDLSYKASLQLFDDSYCDFSQTNPFQASFCFSFQCSGLLIYSLKLGTENQRLLQILSKRKGTFTEMYPRFPQTTSHKFYHNSYCNKSLNALLDKHAHACTYTHSGKKGELGRWQEKVFITLMTGEYVWVVARGRTIYWKTVAIISVKMLIFSSNLLNL